MHDPIDVVCKAKFDAELSVCAEVEAWKISETELGGLQVDQTDKQFVDEIELNHSSAIIL